MFEIFRAKMPDRQIIAMYRMGGDKVMVHATKDGQMSVEPNTYTVSLDGSVKMFSPIDNLRKYHKIHDPKNLLWRK
jgi:hypothetical protein